MPSHRCKKEGNSNLGARALCQHLLALTQNLNPKKSDARALGGCAQLGFPPQGNWGDLENYTTGFAGTKIV